MKSVLLTVAVLSLGAQSFAEYENGHLPGTPIQKREAAETPPPFKGVINLRRERTHPAVVPPVVTMSDRPHQGPYGPGEPVGPPIEKMVVAGGERTIDHPVPPVTLINHNGEGYENGHLPGTPIQKMVAGDNNRIIDPPAVAMTGHPAEAPTPDHTVPPVKMVVAGGERTIDHPVPPVTLINHNGEGYENGHLPGTPIQKMVAGDNNRIIDPPAVAMTGHPAEAPTPDHTVPPVKGVINLPMLVSTLANLSPDVELNPQSVFWAGAAVMTVQLVRAGAMAYTRNPQLAAFVPPVTISNGDGSYKVPSHAKYTLGDARYIAAVMADLSPEAAEDYASTLEPELVEYTLQVSEAIRTGMAEDYARECPNPDLCV